MGILNEIGRVYAETYINTLDAYGEISSGKSMVNGVRAMQDIHLDVVKALKTSNERLNQAITKISSSRKNTVASGK